MAQTAAQGREYQGVSIPPVGTYELDRVHTVVGFVARHMLSKVRGQFTEFTGTIQVADSPEDSRVLVDGLWKIKPIVRPGRTRSSRRRALRVRADRAPSRDFRSFPAAHQAARAAARNRFACLLLLPL